MTYVQAAAPESPWRVFNTAPRRCAARRDSVNPARVSEREGEQGFVLLDYVLGVALLGMLALNVYQNLGTANSDTRAENARGEIQSVYNATLKAYRSSTTFGTAAVISSAVLLKTGDVQAQMNLNGAGTTISNLFNQNVVVTGNGARQFFVDYPGVPEAECNSIMEGVIPGTQIVSISVGTSGTARLPGSSLNPTNAQADCAAAATAPVTLRFTMSR